MPRDGTATRVRILDAAQSLVMDNGFAATSVDQVIHESGTSKGAFFHHFDSKAALARSLLDRYVEADLAQLTAALAATADVADPAARVIAFLRHFEHAADELTAEETSCLYIAALTERQLAPAGTHGEIERAVVAWREAVAELLRAAYAACPVPPAPDPDDLADHLFATFEGAFLLCRSLGSAAPMQQQLRVLRQLVEGILGQPSGA